MTANTSKESTLFTEMKVAILAFLVSALALVISYFQLQSTISHNKLSLRPIISIVHNSLNKPNPNLKKSIIHIHNNGTGPATFTNNVKIFYEGQLIDQQEVAAFFHVLERERLVKESYCIEYGALVGATLGPNTDDYLVRFKDLNDEDLKRYGCHKVKVRNKINQVFSKITIEAEYRSVYEQPFTAKSLKAIKNNGI